MPHSPEARLRSCEEALEQISIAQTVHYTLFRAMIGTHPDRPALLRAFDREVEIRRAFDSGSPVPDEAIDELQAALESMRGLIARSAG